MPSYAPLKPAPKRPPRPRELSFDWPVRRTAALKTVTQLIANQPDEHLRKYLDEARTLLVGLSNVTRNKVYSTTFTQVQRLVLLGLGLARER